VHAQCALEPTTDKMEGGLLVIYLSLGVSFPLKIFLPTPLELSRAFKNKQKRTTEYENHKKVRIKKVNFTLKLTVFF